MKLLLWLLWSSSVWAQVLSPTTPVAPEPSPDPRTRIIRVNDFSAGMEPNVNHYLANDPSRIVLSQNFYSVEAGGRQLRHGYVELVDSTSAASNAGVSGVDAIFAYDPAVGERKLMYSIGGKWLYGDLDTSAAKITTSVLVPYLTAPIGDKLNWAGDSAWYTSDSGSGARFIEHLQVGDTLSFGVTLPTTFQRRIRWIIDNKKVKFASGGLTLDSGVYTARRGYHNDSAIQPYYLQYGDDLFTGTKRDRAQVIYPTSTNQYAIRPMGIADSVQVDAIYFRFGDTSAITRSFDTASDGREYLWLIQVVDRNKGWDHDVWGQSHGEATETFYFRFGNRPGDSIRAVTYRIYGNTDTSLFLAAMFVDTITNRGFCDTTARYKADTLDFRSGLVGKRGYIFSSAGNYKTVHTGAGSLSIYGGGAVLVTPDSLHFDSLYGSGGTYFVRLLEPVSIPLVVFGGFRVATYYYLCGTNVTTPVGWELVSRSSPFFNYNLVCYEKYTYRIPLSAVPNRPPSLRPPASKRYKEVNEFTFFPVLDIDHKRDSMFIRSALSFDPGAAKVVAPRWEIVRVDLPMWSGMSEFRQELHAWGDTTALGTANRSKANVPGALGVHAWSANDDILVGDNPSEAVTWVGGYDDQLTIGQKEQMVSTVDGLFFSQLSMNIGMVSPRAVYLHNKEFYWPSSNGFYSAQRRDLAGYSVQSILPALDPVFNSWNQAEYGLNTVPFYMNPALKDQSILTFNERDKHLYFFFAQGTSTIVNRCLTYDMDRGVADGYLTFGAGAAIATSFHDTTRLIFGSATGPVIYAYDYNWTDKTTGIDAVLRGAPFHCVDENGWPVKSQLRRAWFTYRSSSGSIDTAAVNIIGEDATTVIPLVAATATVKTYQDMGWGTGNYSLNWQWEIYFEGNNTNANVFKPLDLMMEFVLGEDE